MSELPAIQPDGQQAFAELALAESYAIEAETEERHKRLRGVLKLGVVGRYSDNSLSRHFNVGQSQIRRDRQQLIAAIRGELFQDAAHNKNLLAEVVTIFVSSQQRIYALSRQVEVFESNYVTLVKILERFARQDPNDPVQPNIRAQIALAREIRVIHKDIQAEERHMMQLLKETGLLREMQPGQIERSAEASLDVKLLQDVVNIVIQTLRDDSEIPEYIQIRVTEKIGSRIDDLITKLHADILDQNTVTPDAQLVAGGGV